MSTIVQHASQPMSIYFNNGPPSSILLNGPAGPSRNNWQYPQGGRNYTPRTRSSLPPSSFKNTKIRFAPLPDPRKDAFGSGGSEEDIPDLVYSQQRRSSTLSEGRSSYPSAPAQSDETDRDDASSTNGGGRKKKKGIMKLLSVNTSPIQDATLNLFRASSRDSNSSSDDVNSNADTSSLSRSKRRQSWGSLSKDKESTFGFSLTGKSKQRTGSASYMSGPASASALLGGSSNKDNGLPIPPSPRGKSQPLRPTISAPSTTDAPIRMLNGRVYGQKSATKSTDWTEPEFVEWGYGGMGSVKSGEAFYGGVQGNHSAVAGGGGDDYDASGMGWVQRRREERARREREAKDKEERAKKHANEQRAVEKRMESQSPVPTPSTESTPKVPTQPSGQEHDYRTVSVPHQHHSRHPSRSNSLASTPTGSTGSVPTLATTSTHKPKPSPLTQVTSSSNNTPKFEKPSELIRSESTTSSSSNGSTGDDDDSSRREDEDDDDEEDEDEEIRDESRVTSLCAGNEKISRHRE